MSNLSSPRARWAARTPMAAHDALPAPLRRWLAEAALPWSIPSAKRAWGNAMRKHRNEAAALDYLSRVEAATLRREAAEVWGKSHPAAQ
jgi:hypothetical protein